MQFKVDGIFHEARTKDAIRTLSAKCVVLVKDGVAIVELVKNDAS